MGYFKDRPAFQLCGLKQPMLARIYRLTSVSKYISIDFTCVQLSLLRRSLMAKYIKVSSWILCITCVLIMELKWTKILVEASLGYI